LVLLLLFASGCGKSNELQNKVSSLQTQNSNLQSKVQELESELKQNKAEREEVQAERDVLKEQVDRFKKEYELRNHISNISYNIIEALKAKDTEKLKKYVANTMKITDDGLIYYRDEDKYEFSYPNFPISRLRERGYNFIEKANLPKGKDAKPRV